MIKMTKHLTAACLIFLHAGAAGAEETAAVLSSDLPSYREAYEAFKTALGKPVELLPLGTRLSKDVKVIVAFGGKAALQSYPARTTLIYALAPGIEISADTHDGPTAKIKMEPEAAALLVKLLEVHPRLTRLGVIWSSDGEAAAMELLAAAAKKRGIKTAIERISGNDELPGALRRLKGKADALWLPPDPLVINARNFELIKHYSYDNDVPFYTPVEGLTEKGALASVFIPPAEMGRATAAAALDALSGKELDREIFVPRVRLAVNLSAARACEVVVPPDAVKTADKVFP